MKASSTIALKTWSSLIAYQFYMGVELLILLNENVFFESPYLRYPNLLSDLFQGTSSSILIERTFLPLLVFVSSTSKDLYGRYVQRSRKILTQFWASSR